MAWVDMHNGLMELYMQLHDNIMPEKRSAIMKLWERILNDKEHHIIVAEKEGKHSKFL